MTRRKPRTRARTNAYNERLIGSKGSKENSVGIPQMHTHILYIGIRIYLYYIIIVYERFFFLDEMKYTCESFAAQSSNMRLILKVHEA